MAAEPTAKSARAEQAAVAPPAHHCPGLVLRRRLARGRAQPVFGTVLDPLLQLRLFDDPSQVFGISAGNLGVALAAVLAKVKAGIERRLGRPAHQFTPAAPLDQLLEDPGV